VSGGPGIRSPPTRAPHDRSTHHSSQGISMRTLTIYLASQMDERGVWGSIALPVADMAPAVPAGVLAAQSGQRGGEQAVVPPAPRIGSRSPERQLAFATVLTLLVCAITPAVWNVLNPTPSPSQPPSAQAQASPSHPRPAAPAAARSPASPAAMPVAAPTAGFRPAPRPTATPEPTPTPTPRAPASIRCAGGSAQCGHPRPQ
jgi:hypothetical protein